MLESRKLHGLPIIIVAGVCLSLMGCAGSKINKANFDKVSIGMPEEDVEAILGKGDEQADLNMPNMGINVPNLGGGGVGRSMKTKTWEDGSKSIIITFKDGKVMGKVTRGF